MKHIIVGVAIVVMFIVGGLPAEAQTPIRPSAEKTQVINCIKAPCPSDRFGVTSPATGDIWMTGETYTIAWSVVEDYMLNKYDPYTGKTISITLQFSPACLDTTPACAIRQVAPYMITENASNTGNYTWTVPSDLSGIYLGESRIIVTVNATGQQAISDRFTITAKPTTSDLQITTTSMPDGQFGQSYSHQFIASGGTTPYTWSLGYMPDWRIANIRGSTGLFAGQPYTAGPSRVSVTVTDSRGASTSKSFTALFTTPQTETPHAAGSLVLGLDNIPSSVSLVVDGHQRKIFPLGEVFMAHGYKWDKIVRGNSGDQALFVTGGFTFPSGSLVKESNNPRNRTVYLIYPGNVKRAFASYEAFTEMGYKPSMVWNAPLRYLDGFATGDPIRTGERHPDGTDVVHRDSKLVYYIENGVLRPYPSAEVYNSWHTFNFDFSRVVPANKLDTDLPLGAAMTPRVYPN